MKVCERINAHGTGLGVGKAGAREGWAWSGRKRLGENGAKKALGSALGKRLRRTHLASWATRTKILLQALAGQAACRWDRPPPARSALTHAPGKRRARAVERGVPDLRL